MASRRASTAAPRYFEPERIVISQGSGEQKSVQGEFVDGGVFVRGHLIEAVMQLRGQAGERQLDKARTALVHGMGGIF